jgi:hypothetical protein
VSDEEYRYFRKLESHPDKKEVVRLISEGKNPYEIDKLLVKRYPDDKKRWLGSAYLYRYRQQEFPHLTAKMTEKPKIPRKKVDRARKKSISKTLILPEDEEDIAQRIMRLTGQKPRPQMPKEDIPDEKLLRWVAGNEGFIAFVEDLIIERGNRVILQEYQTEMSQKFLDYDRVAICAGGQVGKDFMMQNFILWWAITHAGSLQLILCATQAQSSALKLRVEDKLMFTEDLHGTYVGSRTMPVQTITFTNGSQAMFLTARSQVAGYTNVDIVWVNEARFVKDEEVARVSPLLGIGGGKMFVLSRPLYRRGYFWEFYSRLSRINQEQTMKIPTEMNKFFDPKVVEDDRKTMSEHLFRADYMAEFADAGSSYFDLESIDACTRTDFEHSTIYAEKDYIYSIGIDPARLRDTSTMIMVGQHKNPERKPRYKVTFIHGFHPGMTDKPATFLQQRAYLRFLHSQLKQKNGVGFTHIIPEYVGMGISYSDDLIEEWREHIGSPSLIKPYITGNAVMKLDLYNFLKNTIETRDIAIPLSADKLIRELQMTIAIPLSADKLIRELQMTQFGATERAGKLTIETPITDDYADGLALALWGFKKPFEIGIAAVRREMPRPELLR